MVNLVVVEVVVVGVVVVEVTSVVVEVVAWWFIFISLVARIVLSVIVRGKFVFV